MFSRQLLKAASLTNSTTAASVLVKETLPALSSTCVRSAFTEGPERDLVNFPRRVFKPHSDPTRFLFIPEEWFDFFYKKTGVTGPYVLGGGYISYLLSKEVWVYDHDFPYVVAMGLLISLGYYKGGDIVGKFIKNLHDAREAEIKSSQVKALAEGKKLIDHYKKEMWRTEAQKEIIAAKKENVHLQLEAEYRNRALMVYNQVKQRLEYQAQIENIDRRIAHKHQVQWIIDNVKKSITPQQEKDALKNCFADLKALAASA